MAATKKTKTASAGKEKEVKPKKASATKKATKKATSTKVASKKTSAKKTAAAKTAPAKKAVAVKTTATKKATDKKAAPKKSTTKKAAASKTKDQKKKPFVMPETHTTKARKYTPAFAKSILDNDAEANSGPVIRYSDAELQEFKDLINKKLDAAKKELVYLQGLITRKGHMGGDGNSSRYMTMEDGSLSMEREQLSQMASRQISFIDHLEKALIRIENKTYGICRVTGKLIDKARLRAVPHATLSIEAKMGINK